jgi:NTE family protein
MKQSLAFVLAGGGARGALQVGALRALLEAGIRPDLVVGTSVGAINAVFLGLHGFNSAALDRLEQAWFAAAKAELLPPNPAWITMRVVFNRIRFRPDHRLRDFFIAQGLAPDIHFGDLPGPPMILVSADLNCGQPVFYGIDPQQSVLEGVLASTALPPWVHPLEVEDRFLMDGGSISNLPIEPAILHGATEIIALDLPSRGEVDQEAHGFGPFWSKLLTTIGDRQIYLEMELARAKGIPVHLVGLTSRPPVPIWDFSQTQILVETGYQQMKSVLKEGKIPSYSQPSGWFDRLMKWVSSPKPELRSAPGKDLKARKEKRT